MRTFHLIMNNELKQQFPQWVTENEKGRYSLCMSDDLDSLFSCYMLNRFLGYEVEYFYSFNTLYQSEKATDKETIYVDIATETGKCWDNHVTLINKNIDSVNQESANLNSINQIDTHSYFNKYCGSTLLQIMSYYAIPLPKDKERLLILLAIDSTYLGHYDSRFKWVHNHYLNDLGYAHLIDFLDTVSKSDFNNIIYKYNLKGKIYMVEGKLETDIKLDELGDKFSIRLQLPTHSFSIQSTYENKYKEINYSVEKPKTGIFSLALTGKYKCKYSY